MTASLITGPDKCSYQKLQCISVWWKSYRFLKQAVSLSKHIFIAIENLSYWFSEQISPGRQLKSHWLHTVQGLLQQNTNTISLTDEGKYQQTKQTENIHVIWLTVPQLKSLGFQFCSSQSSNNCCHRKTKPKHPNLRTANQTKNQPPPPLSQSSKQPREF